MQRLADGGPSAKAGVEVGDIIVSAGNKPVKGQMDFTENYGRRADPAPKSRWGF